MILCIYNESLHFCDIESRTIMQFNWIHYYKIHFCSHTECKDRCYSKRSSLDFALSLNSISELVMGLEIKTEINLKSTLYVKLQVDFSDDDNDFLFLFFFYKKVGCVITNLQEAILLSICEENHKTLLNFTERATKTPYNCMFINSHYIFGNFQNKNAR